MDIGEETVVKGNDFAAVFFVVQYSRFCGVIIVYIFLI